MAQCPGCQSEKVIRHGSIHIGKPQFGGKACGRQFGANPQHKRISAETKALVDKRVVEGVPLAGLVRVSGVSARGLPA